MKTLDKEKIEKGIAAYAHEQRLILRLIRKHEVLRCDDFDRIFYSTKRILKPRPIMGETFILTTIFSYRDMALEILKYLVLLNQVSAEQRGQIMVYRVAQGENN